MDERDFDSENSKKYESLFCLENHKVTSSEIYFFISLVRGNIFPYHFHYQIYVLAMDFLFIYVPVLKL